MSHACECAPCASRNPLRAFSTRTDAVAKVTGRKLDKVRPCIDEHASFAKRVWFLRAFDMLRNLCSWIYLDRYEMKGLNSHLALQSGLQFTSLVGSEPLITSMLLEVDV